MEIVAKFDGGATAQHRLPAFEGAQSLEGIARSITLVAHYAVTGDIRKRYPFDETAKLYIETTRPGSFETVFSLLTDPNTSLVTTAVGTLSIGVAGGLIVEILKIVSKRLIGQDFQPTIPQVASLLERRPGEFEALGEAIEPSLKKAHTVIGNGASQVFIISGSNNVVNLNSRSKDYISTTVHTEQRRQLLVSVGMLNANTRYGRVFNEELGRTVPFLVSRTAEARTMSNLARSLQIYSARNLRQNDSKVQIIFTTEAAIDGTDKRYIIEDAFFPELEA